MCQYISKITVVHNQNRILLSINLKKCIELISAEDPMLISAEDPMLISAEDPVYEMLNTGL